MVKYERSDKTEVLSRDFTVNIKKRVHNSVVKKKAPRALRAIKKFAQVHMATSDVRIDTELNKFIWSRGITNIPTRVRIRCSRLRNDDVEAKEECYTVVSYVPVESFHGLTTQTAEEEE